MRMSIFRLVAAAFLIAPASKATALVNPIDQSLTENHIDYEGQFLTVTRNFHSNRKSAGMFGKGWCSLWETKLTTAPDYVEFNLCGDGNTVRFLKSRGWKAADPSYTLQQKTKGFEVIAGFRNRYVFDRGGRLSEAHLDDKAVKLTYEGKFLKTVSSGPESVAFVFNGDRLAALKPSSGPAVEYTFEGAHLKSVKAGGTATYRYEHNRHGQLTTVWVAGRKREYGYAGKGVDEVSFAGCRERIKVRPGKNERVVEVEKSCPSGKQTKTFTIAGTDRADGLKLTTKQNTGLKEREWKNGRVVMERGTAGVTQFSYDKYGAIKELAMPGFKLTVNERSSGFPRRVTIKSAGEAGNRAVALNWDKGRLSAVQSAGLSFRIMNAPGRTTFTGKDFALTKAEKAGKRILSGRLMNMKIEPFAMDGGLYDYKPAQLEALGTITALATLTEKLEGL